MQFNAFIDWVYLFIVNSRETFSAKYLLYSTNTTYFKSNTNLIQMFLNTIYNIGQSKYVQELIILLGLFKYLFRLLFEGLTRRSSKPGP